MDTGRLVSTLERRGVTLDSETLQRVTDGPIERLLTLSNPKTAKGEKYGYLTTGLHLAPSVQSGFNLCPAATVGCAAACLNTAGRGGFDARIPAARNRKSLWYMLRRDEFMSRLVHEIRADERTANRHGLKLAVRLNVLSDQRWENIGADGAPNLMALFPHIPFYDYTKLTNRRDLPANYTLTLSAHEGTGDATIADAIGRGMNVAVVFRSADVMRRATGVRSAGIRMRGMSMPTTYAGFPVIDGDRSDLRFLDPRGVIVGLRAKGDAVTDSSGFVRDVA